jgi:hypothetical protein
MKGFIAVLLSVLLMACQGNKTHDVPNYSIFPETKITLEDHDVLKVSSFVVCDSFIVTKNLQSDTELSFIPLRGGEAYHAIKVGNGPGEVLPSSNLTAFGGKPYLVDLQARKVYRVNCDYSKGEARISYYGSFPYMMMCSTCLLGDGRYLTSTCNDSCLVMTCDTAGAVISSLPYPQGSEVSKHMARLQSTVWGAGHYAVSPDGKHFSTSYPTENYKVFGGIKEAVLSIDKEEHGEWNRIEEIVHNFRIRMSGDGLACAFDIASINNEYVAHLMCGVSLSEYSESSTSLCKTISIYDWIGNQKCNLCLPVGVDRIYYSSLMKRMYALSKNPEPLMYVFDIEDYIK